jgi:2-oxoglutarate dehydrogenase E1 component
MNVPEPLPDSANLAFLERLYADYLRDPAAVPPAWREHFAKLPDGEHLAGRLRLGPSFRPHSLFNPPAAGDGRGAVDATVPAAGAGGGVTPTPARGAAHAPAPAAISQDRVDQLVRNYRVRGHIIARVDPLHHHQPYCPELKLSFYGFRAADLDRPFSCHSISGPGVRTLREILLLLRTTYCRSIGVQFMHIDQLDARNWLQERMEGTQNRLALTRAEQLRILTRLTDAVIFEEFIQKKYVGAKRFSLEGAESLIPLLDLAIEHAGDQGVEEIIIGMAHRGRLNVLANIVGKSPRQIFREFEDLDAELYVGRGDVKYHLGYHGDWTTATGRAVHLALCFNPSHLEFVNPVALGRVRAKQDRLGDTGRERSMAILIHGDASLAGEGIVQEALNLSELEGYRTGGTLHVVVNNQIGFTTTPAEGRSTRYATDIARMLQSPIFHVNGEDPEAVAQVVRLALDFRREFRRDVFIDMYGYRRYGHNETDEPSFTQPAMYRLIEARPSVRDSYLAHLLRLNEVARAEADRLAAERRGRLEEELAGVRSEGPAVSVRASVLGHIWSRYAGGPERDVPEVDTGVPRERLAQLLDAQTHLPDGFHLHPRLKRLLDARRQMAAGERPLDWAAAEALALATLVTTGTRVRLSGQDSGRGTFSQRHAILHDYQDERPYVPLQQLSPEQAPFEVFNSPLSEAGVLGFEYGFSIGYPDGLVVWEAQFGDFVNAAQVYVDQFLASAEDKWQSLSGLVLLLPHGFEGQGPEHSSARLERLLMLATDDNMQIVYPSTPAQYFHVLRRQVLRPWRKPLIVLTPKSLLRHLRATSALDDLAEGRFRCVLADDGWHGRGVAADPRVGRSSEPGRQRGAGRARAVTRVLLCSGKVYYELLEERERRERRDVALVRIEQFYPLPDADLEAALRPYVDGTPAVWVQEEPANMGAACHFRLRFGSRLLGRLPFSVVSRPAAASPATGSAASHKLEQQRLIDEAFGDAPHDAG